LGWLWRWGETDEKTILQDFTFNVHDRKDSDDLFPLFGLIRLIPLLHIASDVVVMYNIRLDNLLNVSEAGYLSYNYDAYPAGVIPYTWTKCRANLHVPTLYVRQID
jgi:hypothetical protein